MARRSHSRRVLCTMSLNSASPKACSFCNLAEDNELEYGKIYEHNGIVTHYYCLLLSSNMEQKGTDDEGILGFLAEDIQKELRRGKRLVCSYCKKIGATLGCCNVKCKKIFHFPCGWKAGSLHQFFDEFRSYCVNHRPKQKIDDQILKQIKSIDNVCYICYDKVNVNDFVKTLWAPCCRKDAWFHRNCVQQLALSAGYFFKCPLCNNKKDFQKAMLEYGIFVPSQDASWELVPNAFEELLYRHNQCDAEKCLCPKGRKHTSNNAKWELALCRTCGSQGIHMACGQLKWANPVWECDECTSILRNSQHNEPSRRGNSSTIDSSNQNKDSDSDEVLDSDLDSDLDSEISVGTDFPMPCPLPNLRSSISSLDSVLDVRLRPGPRSFKLQQQMIKLDKWLGLLGTDSERKVPTETSLKDTNESSSNNDYKKKEPSTSKQNIPQQENNENNSQKKSQSYSNKKSEPIQKKADIITIESDDDDVELIMLKRKTDLPSQPQQPTEFSNSYIPCVSTSKQTAESLLNTTENSAASKSQSVATTDLSKNDNINLSKPIVLEPKASKKSGPITIPNQPFAPWAGESKWLNTTKTYAKFKNQSIATTDLSKNDNINPPKPIVSEPEASNKSETIIIPNVPLGREFVPLVRESMLDLIDLNSNDLEEIDTIDTSETSVMNIKITNVTSLPPEVFERVPDVCKDVTLDKNTIDDIFLAAATLDQFVTNVPSMKRSIHEASDITDNSKKIKRNSFDEKLDETSSTLTNIIAHDTNTNNRKSNPKNNTNKQRNENTSASKSSETGKNYKNPPKRTSASTNISNPPLNNNQKKNLSTQSIHNADDVRHVNQSEHISYRLEKSGASLNVPHSKENFVACKNMAGYTALPNNNQVYHVSNLCFPINNFYLQEIPNPLIINQDAGKTDETNVYDVPPSNVFLSNVADNMHQAVNQPIILNEADLTTSIPNETTVVNQQKAASKRNLPTSVPSLGNSSSNKSHCDGDAGTRPAETDTTSRKKDAPSSDSHRSVVGKQTNISHSGANCSVFPQVTNNHNTCHQPRLIPRYMNLHDLKFQVCESNNVQMILYDTFSVNISMKNPKDGKSRSAGAAVSREPKESSALASHEASCSSNCIDSIPSERQRFNKFFRSSKNENSLTNDKSTCTKYLAHGQDDAKENLDPIRSRTLLRSGTLDNVNSMNNIDDVVTMSDRFCGETDSETRLVSSDTNLSVLNQTICNTNIDVTDSVTLVPNSVTLVPNSVTLVPNSVTLVPNSCKQGSRVSLENVQQHKPVSVRSVIPSPAEERPGARLFCKETSRIVRGVDFDLNVVNMNKNIEKVSQDDVTVPTNQHTDDKKISNDHTGDSPMLRNDYKHLDSTNVMRPKIDNRNVANITRFNEHSILNKQIDTCDSRKFIRCTAFQENTVRHSGEIRTKSNGFCLKVSVDLCKIQNLIDSEPELFKSREHNRANDQRRRRMSRLPGLDDHARQQVRYCDIENNGSISHCPPKNRELQKSNYTCNIDAFPGANTFLRYQKSNQGSRYFDKNMLDR